MRAGPLSEEKTQAAARCFVCAWVSRDRYQTGPPSGAERRWLARLDRSKKEKGIAGGAVCVYLASADGECLAALPVPAASKPGALAAFLEREARRLKLEPVASKAAGRKERPIPAGARRFVVRTKLDEPTNRGTSRDEIDLPEEQWRKLVPAGAEAHDVPRPVAEAILRCAYPPLPAWDARLAKVERAELRVVPEGGRLRLTGSVRVVYPHRGKPDDGVATARLAGFARLAPDGSLAAFVLASTEGRYAWTWKGKEIVRPLRLAVEMAGPAPAR
ncbi:MAG: hypothetical protein K2W96_06880 [Gemmataceae bacterium]|nr:hypothetical protein [Gemmataceae bacterium]